MGGRGSGRWSGTGRPTVGDALALNINKLVRDGIVRHGVHGSGSLIWSHGITGEQIGSIAYEVNTLDEAAAWFRVHYRVDGEDQDYRIGLVTTRPNYGGRRWWMVCPAWHLRVGKLYLPSGGQIFACRKAYRLAYPSQRERAHERALTKAQTIRIKLGGSASLAEPFPEKPKGMWRRTYDRRRREAEEAELRSWMGVAQWLGKEI